MKYKTLVRTEHLNHNGVLFGGYMLLWVDEYAYIAAIDDYPKTRFVTRGMTAVSFTRSVECGSLLTFDINRVHVGKTSVTYSVDVYARSINQAEEILVFQTQVTFCCVDENGNKKTIQAIS